jgi:hypothetical protein
MARIRMLILAAVGLLLAVACTHATPIGATPRTPVPSPTTPQDVGRLLVEALGGTRYVSAEGYLSAPLRTAMPDTALRAKWDALAGAFGKYKGIGGVSSAPSGADTVVGVEAQFAGGSATVRVTVGSDLQVTVLDIPAPGAPGSPSPASS